MKRFVVLFFLPALCLAIYDREWFDLNNWRCPFYNDGRWGIDLTQTPTGKPFIPTPVNWARCSISTARNRFGFTMCRAG